MLQLSCTQKPASHDRQNGSKRCHGKEDFGMKVAMIGHKDFPSRSGGVEVMVGGLATSLVKRGYEVTVYNRGLQKGHNIYTTEGVQARRIFTFQKASLNAMVYSFLATFDALTRDCDVIHYHAIGPSVPLVIAKLFGKHTVCTVHGLNWKVDKWGGFASAYLRLGERVAAKYADDLVVLSESEWNYFQEKYDRTAILIPNAVQMRQPLPCNLIREKYGLEAGSYILYVGRISPEKGPLDLVEGYLKAHTDKKLVLAGPFAETEYCTTVQEKIAGNPQHHHDGLCGGRRAAGAVQQLRPVRAAQPHRGPFAFAAGGTVAGGEVPRERHPGEHHCDRRLRHRVPHRGHRQSGPGTGAGHRPAADPGAEQSAAGLCAGQF